MKAAPAVPLAARRIGDALRAAGAKRARVTWPSPSWRGRHLEFARDVLGKRTIASHQRETLNAYYKKDCVEGAVVTGQKKGKTETLIILILFDFATEADLNGFIYGPKIEWIDEALWPRLVQDAQRAYYPCAKCRPAHEAWVALVDVDPLDETPRPARCSSCSPLLPEGVKLDPERSEEGLRAPDGRTVRGYTSRKLGGKGGLSGKVRFYCDESSDIPDDTRASIGGNMFGGGKLIAFGNLLYRHGWFYHAFKRDKHLYDFTLQSSSRLSPNCRGRIEWSDGAITENGRWIKFPGGVDKRPDGMNDRPHTADDRPVRNMANRERVEKYLREWSGSTLIEARIDAVPPAMVEGQLAASAIVSAAEERWTRIDDATGVLQFGVDVGRARDPLAIAERRGRKIREIYAEVLGEDDHARGVEILMGMVRDRRRPHERRPRVVYDRTGPEGKRFGKELARYIAASKDPRDDVEVIGIEAGAPPRNIKIFFKRRDELAHHFCNTWLKTGAIPPDGELEAELDATTSSRVPFTWKGTTWEVLRVIDNDELRPILGRSPNKRNACELAVLDVDGDDSQEDAAPPPPERAITAGQAPAPAAASTRRPFPAVDVEEPPRSPFGYQDEIYRSMWGGQ